MTSQGCMRHPSENANFQSFLCFPLLLTAWLIKDSEVWATDEDWVSSNCCVLASATLHWTFTGINCNIQTLVLTIKVPFDIKYNMKCMLFVKENLQEDQELCAVSLGESSTWSIAAHSWEYGPPWRSSLEPWNRASGGIVVPDLGAFASCQLKNSHRWRPGLFNPRYQLYRK